MSAAPVLVTLMLNAPATPDPRGLGGLMVLISGAPRPLPLTEVKVRARVAGDVATTVVEQRFHNAYASPMEALHIFPLPERGAVTEVELRAGEVVVRAECRERVEAERTYQAAVQAGHRAALLTAEREDVHTLRVANLPPGTDVTVRMVLVERLEAQDGRMRWRFPTVVAPRYTPGAAVGHAGPGVAPDTDLVPDASRISPPLRLSGGTRLDLEVELAGPIRSLSSSLHALSLSLEDGGARVAPAANATCDRDFLLSWTTGEPDSLATRAWTDGGHTLIVVEPPSDLPGEALPRDAVFVVDISGSMGGVKMEAAKLALKTALHGLVPGDRFRLLAFDDRVEAMSRDFLAVTDANLGKGDRWIAALRDRGGTEMLPAIQEALAGDTPAGRLRTVLFVTDGQASNEAQLVAAVAGRRKAARFFTLGIDTAVNAGLMQRLARAGGGVATLCTPSDDIEAVVARLEARFGSPLLADLEVVGAQVARPEPVALFAGAPVSLLIEGAPASVRLRATGPMGPWTAELAPSRTEAPLGVAWARERVSWLEDQIALKPFQDEALRGEILRVALAAHIASRFTAFVAVDSSVTVGGDRVTVVQPVERPHGWAEDVGGAAQDPAATAFFAIPAPRGRAAAPMGAPAGAAPRPARLQKAMAPADLDDELDRESLAEAAPAPMASSSLLERAKDALFGGSKKRAASPAPPARPSPVQAPPASAREEAAPLAGAPAASLDLTLPLAGMQAADGSFEGSAAATAAALVLLALRGHTRRVGLRQRVVQKAARWLSSRAEPEAKLALEILAAVEAGATPARDARWAPLLVAGTPGQLLSRHLGLAAG